MDRLLKVTTVLSIALMLLVLFSVRRSHIRVEYSMSWLIAASALLFCRYSGRCSTPPPT